MNATLNEQAYSYTQNSMQVVQAQTYRIVLPSIGVRAEF